MKRQELDQMRQKSITELLHDITGIKKDLLALKLTRHDGKTTNVHSVLAMKRKLAQLLTVVSIKDK